MQLSYILCKLVSLHQEYHTPIALTNKKKKVWNVRLVVQDTAWIQS